MPFIGKDWRSPGEAWVKTESLGWQRIKLIQLHLQPPCNQTPACSWPPRSEFGQHMHHNMSNRRAPNPSERTEMRGAMLRNTSLSSASESSSDSASNSPVSSPNRASSQQYQAHDHHQHGEGHRLDPLMVPNSHVGARRSCCAHPLDPNRRSCDLAQQASLYSNRDRSISRSLSREELDRQNNNRKLYGEPFHLNSSHSYQNFTEPVYSVNSHQQICDESQNLEAASSHEQIQPTIQEEAGSEPVVMNKNNCPIYDTGLETGCNQSAQHSGTCCCSKIQGQQWSTASMPGQPDSAESPRVAPHCRISVRTREVAMYNTISEAFYRLDFCNAIHDIRRFNYICKLLHLLITQNLTTLSGCATRVLFIMLEQVAWEVSSNKRNIHVIKSLLNELKVMIRKYYCWGRPIGSSLLWQQHFHTIERINQIVDTIELTPSQGKDEVSPKTQFADLPLEMIREILLRLSDYRDLINSSQVSPVMRHLVDNQVIWKKLCSYHFTEPQLKYALENYNALYLKKCNTTRGTKYSRTLSADGRTSFRNPVASRGNQSKTGFSQTNERANTRRLARQKDADSEDKKQSSSSHVTRTIKVFDSRDKSTSGQADLKHSQRHTSKSTKQAASFTPTPESSNSKINESSAQFPNSKAASSKSSRLEIDWEHVFHHLRKKFDLKEEYADCLLLCRHCRCLFWKSFGHPCIMNDNGGAVRPASTSDTGYRPQSAGSRTGHGRPSVADLSRNFDSRAQGYDLNSSNMENLAPSTAAAAAAARRSASRQAASASRHQSGGLSPPVQQVQRDPLRRLVDRAHDSSNRSSEDIMPKHVAISPQAFLKFFSL